MDKNEYNIKLDEIKKKIETESYDEAAEIADSVNWMKVKNVSVLVKVAQVYEKAERYEDCKDMLLLAYDRSPIGRMILYHLTEVCIKLKDYELAENYYEDFIDVAPHDSLKYILKYNIRKAQGADLKELIPILEEFKEQEYSEEWAYELAYLYHKAGRGDDCIAACDELILWFGDGPYVERGLELKMLYQPLTKQQEARYRELTLGKKGVTTIDSNAMERAGEYGHGTVEIPQVIEKTEKFNTVNLQNEIAKNMQVIMEAKEKQTVSDSMDNIKKIVEDIPYLQYAKERQVEMAEERHIETDEEIDGSLKINFQELLGEDSDGQMSLLGAEKGEVESQITGQMSISDVLEEWEKTKKAAETALEEANQRKLESAKARALQEAEDIMDRLSMVIPQLDAGVSPNELLRNEYLNVENQYNIENKSETDKKLNQELSKPTAPEIETEEILKDVNQMLEKEIIRLSTENEEMDREIAKATATGKSKEETESTSPITEKSIDENQTDSSKKSFAQKVGDVTESAIQAGAAVVATSQTIAPIKAEEVTTDIAKTLVAEAKDDVFATKKMPSLKDLHKNPEDKWKTGRLPEITLPEDMDEVEEKVAVREIKKLSNDQKAIFSYFVPVKGMEEQLCHTLTNVSRHLKKDYNSITGNIIIQGGEGCGKTMLATSIIKVLQKEVGKPNGKIGKINAQALNKKDVQSLIEKVSGGCMIIEHAGAISKETASKLSMIMEKDTSGLLLILEDTSKGIKKALSQDSAFATKFTEKITVPIFTIDELVAFARAYSNELGYEIEEMAILALYNRITNIQSLDQQTTLTEVKEIVDEAIKREENGGIKKAFSILTAKRYTDDEKIVLREKDFEML